MSIPEEKELSFIERLRDLSWTDFSYVIDGLELASASQYYSTEKDLVTEQPDFKELAAQYEEDEEWKAVARNAEYSSCTMLGRFKSMDNYEDDVYATVMVNAMLDTNGPLSFIWNADINIEAIYLISDREEGYGYFRVDIYSDTSKFPMISNYTLQKVIDTRTSVVSALATDVI